MPHGIIKPQMFHMVMDKATLIGIVLGVITLSGETGLSGPMALSEAMVLSEATIPRASWPGVIVHGVIIPGGVIIHGGVSTQFHMGAMALSGEIIISGALARSGVIPSHFIVPSGVVLSKEMCHHRVLGVILLFAGVAMYRVTIKMNALTCIVTPVAEMDIPQVIAIEIGEVKIIVTLFLWGHLVERMKLILVFLEGVLMLS